MENKVVVFLTLENPPTVFFWDFKVNLSEQLMAAKKYTIIVIFFFLNGKEKKTVAKFAFMSSCGLMHQGQKKGAGEWSIGLKALGVFEFQSKLKEMIA